jgi:hypothetical protein
MLGAQRAAIKRPRCIGARGSEPIYQSIHSMLLQIANQLYCCKPHTMHLPLTVMISPFISINYEVMHQILYPDMKIVQMYTMKIRNQSFTITNCKRKQFIGNIKPTQANTSLPTSICSCGMQIQYTPDKGKLSTLH